MRRGSLLVLAVLFVGAGVAHFTHTALFTAIVPSWLPAPRALVYVSGVFEVAGGVGILVPRWQRRAGLGLILLLLAVFPANVFMALNPERFADVPALLLYARLPLQFVLIGWVAWGTRLLGDDAPSRRPNTSR